MKLIYLTLALTAIYHTQEYSNNYGCQPYKEALFQYGDAFSAYSQNNSARYYSQAPSGKSLGKCNVIPCIGSPVFLIEKAHQWLDMQFDLQNKYSSVKYLGLKRLAEESKKNHICYKMVFKLENPKGHKYIGIEVDAPIQGLGNATYKRMIIHKDLIMVKKILKETNWDLTKALQCGDQKLMYSYFNRGESNPLGYNYAGKNNNTVSDTLLAEIHAANSQSSARNCSNNHYDRVFNRTKGDYFRDETGVVSGPVKENFYCAKKGLSVDRIRLGCRLTGKFVVDNLESFQLIRKDDNGNLISGPIQGNKGLPERYYKDISLNGSAEVSIEFWGADVNYYTKLDEAKQRSEIRITTWDSRGKQIDEIGCGSYFNHNLLSQTRMSTKNFLGFWYNYDNHTNIQRLGVVKFK